MTRLSALTITLLCGALVAPSAGALAETRLDGPDLYKAHRRASNLTAADLNGNGHVDLAVISNDEGVVHLFLRDDSAEAERPFRRDEVALDRVVRAMVATDVNGNGRTDLLIAGSPASLAVLYQDEDGRFQAPLDLDREASFLALGDLNGNGRDDLLVVTGKEFRIHYRGTRALDLDESEVFHVVREPASHPLILDLDGDGASDIAWRTSDARDRIVVRLQSPEGTFPDEVVLETVPLRTLDAVHSRRGMARFAGVHGRNRQAVVLELTPPGDEARGRPDFGTIRFLAAGPEETDASVTSTVADVNGDGRPDLVLAAPSTPSLRLLRQSRAGAFLPSSVPSLEGVRSVLPWPAERGEPTHLIVLSRDENTVAVVQPRDGAPYLQFPLPLPLKGEPFAAAVAPVAEGDDALLWVASRRDGDRIVEWMELDLADGTTETVGTLELEEATENPTGLFAADLNRNGRTDLAVFYEFQSPQVFLQTDEGAFELLAAGGILAGMLDGSNAGSFRTVSEANGASSTLVLKRQYARLFHLDDDNRVVVSRQLNAPASNSRLEGATTGDFTGDGETEFALLDMGTREIVIHGADETASDEPMRRVRLDGGNYRSIHALDLDGSGRDDIVLVAPDRIAVLPSTRRIGRLDLVASRETDVTDGGYGLVRQVEFRSGPHGNVAAVEMRDNVLEILALEQAGGRVTDLKSLYRFKMFDTEAGLAQRVNLDAPPEPREMITVDLNDNGLNDLVTLTHDYVIVYYQEPVDEE